MSTRKEPDWLDRNEYPFAAHWLDLDAGRMHYIDEGHGSPLVLVHGTPDWSFSYRNLIKRLATNYRCIAPDHLGFGLSDKPRNYSYAPQEQAAKLRRLIETLGLRGVTLVLHDFGGPFGLAYALEHPENVQGLVLMNTWMWSLRGDPHFEQAARLFSSPIGRVLYLQFNFSVRFMMPLATADKSRLPRAIHEQYLRALPGPDARRGTWAYARALIGASEWFDGLWQQRERIQDRPALILWGMRDPAFREKELLRLESVFTHRRTVRLPNTGHFVQEEQPERASAEIESFLAR